MKNIDLQVAIAAYGFSPFLKACVDSLRKQTIPCTPTIFASTAPDALRHYCAENNVELVIHDQGGSISNDWNTILKLHTTGLLLIAHHDDVYAPTFIERCLSLWAVAPDMLMSFTDHAELDAKGNIRAGINVMIKRRLIKNAIGNLSIAKSSSIRRSLLSLGNPISCPSVIFNRDALPEFQFSPDWAINLDWDAWDRICALGGLVGYIDEPVTYHRVHPASETSNGIRDGRRQQEDLRMFKRYWPSWFAKTVSVPYALSCVSNPKFISA